MLMLEINLQVSQVKDMTKMILRKDLLLELILHYIIKF